MNEGYSIREIAKEVGASISTVDRWLKLKANLTKRRHIDQVSSVAIDSFFIYISYQKKNLI
jgi:IS30 family transposase